MSATQRTLSTRLSASATPILQRLFYETIGIFFLALASCSVIASDRFHPIQFAAPINLNLGSGPVDRLCAADFNGDGFPDLAVGYNFNSIAILTNNGTGTMQLWSAFTAQGVLGAGDFNGDNKVDVVTGNYLTTWLNNGDGTFTGTTNIFEYVGSGMVVVGDFNRDQKPDLAICTGGVSIYLGQTNGTFSFLTNYNSVGGTAIAAADLDGNTRLDLVTIGYGLRYTTVLLGNGNGTFAPPTNYPDPNADYRYSVATGDVNNDGKPDLLIGDAYGLGSLALRLNNGDGTFGPAKRIDFPWSPKALAVADFNGDGNIDIVAGNPLRILPGLGDGTFGSPVTNLSSLSLPPLANQSLVVADFDGDGRPDIATPSVSNNCVSILLNRTPPPVSISIQNTSGLLVVNWPDTPGFVLEFSTNLAVPSSWSIVTNPSFVVNGERIVVTTTEGERRFFRLRK